MKKIITHQGWFGICPVWLTDVNESEAPLIIPKYHLEFLFWIVVKITELGDIFTSVLGGEPPDGYDIYMEELDKRFEYEYEEKL